MRQILTNLWNVPRNFMDSVVRHGKPTSDRARAQTVFGNLFLHIHPVRVHRHSLRFSTTLGLGLISLATFLILCITGVLLMVYYKPATADAYNSILDIQYVVPAGRVMRNVHRWGAHVMVLMVMLHMARVFYTGGYKKPREFNWLIGLVLLVITMALSFTGYLLPWDQLAYWAATIGSNIAKAPQELTDALGITDYIDPGGFAQQLLLGGRTVGQEAVTRFYVLHVIVLPAVLFALIGVHFWRIRKDGGLVRPEAEEALSVPEDPALTKTYGLMALVQGKTPATDQDSTNTISSWPDMMYIYGALMMLTTAALMVLGYFFDAPLKEMANPAVPENPAKAPWYFLALQEMVSYSAFAGGMLIPGITMLGLGLIPYLDRETDDLGVWFGCRRGRRTAATTFVFSSASVVLILAFTIKYGWLRTWYPSIPQIVITMVNPGTLLTVVFAAWSLWVLRRTASTRLAAISLFTCFMVAFTILTYFATYHRGPNWGFYWWGWPEH